MSTDVKKFIRKINSKYGHYNDWGTCNLICEICEEAFYNLGQGGMWLSRCDLCNKVTCEDCWMGPECTCKSCGINYYSLCDECYWDTLWCDSCCNNILCKECKYKSPEEHFTPIDDEEMYVCNDCSGKNYYKKNLRPSAWSLNNHKKFGSESFRERVVEVLTITQIKKEYWLPINLFELLIKKSYANMIEACEEDSYA